MTSEHLAPNAVARLLGSALVTIEVELAALGTEAGWRPAPGEWCANEVVGHLVEAERRGFAGRIRAILAADRPTFERWDQPAVAAARRDDLRPATELAAEFRTVRLESLDLVASLQPADLSRVGIHPRVGELRVDELLGEWVHHDREHIRQLHEVVQRRVWGQMGATRRFSDPSA